MLTKRGLVPKVTAAVAPGAAAVGAVTSYRTVLSVLVEAVLPAPAASWAVFAGIDALTEAVPVKPPTAML